MRWVNNTAPAGPVCNPYQFCQSQHHATPGPDHAPGSPSPTTQATTTAADIPATSTPTSTSSSYLTNLSEELSRELGDSAHHRSNRTQLLNLWQKSGLSPDEFARVVYHSRELTHRYATLRPGEKLPGNGQPRNKMAYFFRVVRDKLFGTDLTAAPALAGSNTPGTQPTTTGQQPQSGEAHPAVTPASQIKISRNGSHQRLIPQPAQNPNSTVTPSPAFGGTETRPALPASPDPAALPVSSPSASASCSTATPASGGTNTPYHLRPGYGEREQANHRATGPASSTSFASATGPGYSGQPRPPRPPHSQPTQSRPQLSPHQPQPQPDYQTGHKPTTTGPGSSHHQPPRYHERGYSFDRPATAIPDSWRRLMSGGSSSNAGSAGSNNGSPAPAT